MTAADWRAPFVFRDNRVVHVTGMCIQGSCCVLETLDAATQTFIEFRVSIAPQMQDADDVLFYSRQRVSQWLMANRQARPLSRGDKVVVIELR